MVWTSAHEEDDRNVYFAESLDHGASYGTNYRIHQEVFNPQQEPAIAYDALGTIHVCWQTQIESWDYDLLYAHSDSYGIVFSKPERVNDDPYGSMHAQSEADIIVTQADELLAVWMDPREEFDENVYFARSAATTGIATGHAAGHEDGDHHGDGSLLPQAVRVFPNPMVSTTRLLATSASIYDVHGRLLRRLPAGGDSGQQAILWDGRDRGGQRVAPGAYFALLESEHGRATRRIIVTR